MTFNFENDVNVASNSNKQRNLKKILEAILKVNDENSKNRIRSQSRIR